jgi:ubiquinone/menaquinone biosynthesis C-methylase UbiE
VVDRQFSDAGLADFYDMFCPWEERDDLAFYLPLVMSAGAVLDVGCGTGMLLRRARQAGHTGRLCGLDPAGGMLVRASKRADIEWILGDLASIAWDREFDLIVMTGHAFQVFVTTVAARRRHARMWRRRDQFEPAPATPTGGKQQSHRRCRGIQSNPGSWAVYPC